LGRQGKQRPEGEKAEIRKEELGVSPPQRSADKRSGDGRREGRGKKSEVGG